MKYFEAITPFAKFESLSEKPSFEFFELTQVHSNIVVSPNEANSKSDGFYFKIKEFSKPLVIKTADCLPVLIYNENEALFVHAGWRGVATDILKPSFKATNAIIGPSIRKCCFEIQEDFKEHFPNSSHFIKKNSKTYFSLVDEAKLQLRKNNPNINILDSMACTFCHSLQMHSYRRDQTQQRIYNVLSIR